MDSETNYMSTFAKKLHEKRDISVITQTTVFSTISDCIVCKQCGGEMRFLQLSVHGFGFKLNIKRITCDKEINSVCSSPLIGCAYEINRRFTLAMRVFGKGL